MVVQIAIVIIFLIIVAIGNCLNDLGKDGTVQYEDFSCSGCQGGCEELMKDQHEDECGECECGK